MESTGIQEHVAIGLIALVDNDLDSFRWVGSNTFQELLKRKLGKSSCQVTPIATELEVTRKCFVQDLEQKERRTLGWAEFDDQVLATLCGLKPLIQRISC